MLGLLGEKLGMSQVIQDDGVISPVTYVAVTPNVVVQVKTVETDGYNAVCLGYKKLKKPTKTKKYKYIREFRTDEVDNYKIGDVLTAESLQEAKAVDVSGTSKGKGFQGVMKRHGFHGGPQTHGSGHKREPGSVGACAKPGRIMKGQKLPGRMGNERSTLARRKILTIDTDNNIIGIHGPIAGALKSLITIKVA